MKKTLMFCIILALALSCVELPALHFARWSTSMGVFTAELYDQWVPITANNFISLANSGFYNNLIFHRVVEGFVIQDGCPYGTGYGGPGYTIPDEFYPDLHHDQAGILAMARTSAPNSAGSQYYITLAPTPNLDGNYAIFGKVIQGLDTVMAIGSVPVDANDRPLTPVDIDTLRILDLAIGIVTPSDSTTYVCNVNEPQMFIVEVLSTLPTTYEWFRDGMEIAGMDFICETTFDSPGQHSLLLRISNADWTHEITWDILAQGSPVDDPLPPASVSLEIVPHPVREGSLIKLTAPFAGEYDFGIYDLKGRRLRFIPGAITQDRQLFWDGLDGSGNRLPAGVYIIRASAGNHTLSKRCVVID
jgi:cyclophilin family peptidyl-prolyl cis-trans isomerase